MIRSRVLCLLLVTLLLLCTSSCQSKNAFQAGERLSVPEMEKLQESLLSEENVSGSGSPQGVEALPDDAECYFVLGSGAVYHTNKKCYYLKNSADVCFGTLAEASKAGKTRLCSACGKDSSSEVLPDTDVTVTEKERVCYYVSGGSVWHYERSCSALTHCEDVISGSVAQAIVAGKLRACAKCSD